ncbi:MAG: glycosyltransferase family 25 protein [Simkaniaceae bacterium]|nr:glycosyltransferase family 25 protein [Simkaniaceae bacterium]
MRKFLLVLLSATQLFSYDIAPYFKKIENATCKSIKNIDFIYTINLDERPEKWEKTLTQLSKYNIKPYRFSAVNGWHLSLEAVGKLSMPFDRSMRRDVMGTRYPLQHGGKPEHGLMTVHGYTYLCHCMSRGAVGICLSHLSVLQHAFDNGYKTIWVMEDDIHVLRDPRILSKYIDELNRVNPNWDILFTDRDTRNNRNEHVPCLGYAIRPNFHVADPGKFARRNRVSKNLRYIGNRYGAYSMIVSRRGMQKLLNFFKTYKLFLPYDMDFAFPPGISFYTVVNDVVTTTLNAPSDNGGPNYLKK